MTETALKHGCTPTEESAATTRNSAELIFTGERIVPGDSPEIIFREHQMRYAFAGQFVKGCAVLDLASGTGIGTDYLLKAGATKCVGLDVDTPAVKYATSAYRSCQFVTCDAMSLCLADASIDVIVSFETIEHVSNPRVFLSECKRVLRPGGLLICSTPRHEVFRWATKNPFHPSEMTTGEFCEAVGEFFPEYSTYEQSSLNYPRYLVACAVKNTLLSIATKLRMEGVVTLLKRLRKRLAGAPEAARCTDREFTEPNERYAEYAVVPAVPRFLRKTYYVLLVGRKMSGSRSRREYVAATNAG